MKTLTEIHVATQIFKMEPLGLDHKLGTVFWEMPFFQFFSKNWLPWYKATAKRLTLRIIHLVRTQSFSVSFTLLV